MPANPWMGLATAANGFGQAPQPGGPGRVGAAIRQTQPARPAAPPPGQPAGAVPPDSRSAPNAGPSGGAPAAPPPPAVHPTIPNQSLQRDASGIIPPPGTPGTAQPQGIAPPQPMGGGFAPPGQTPTGQWMDPFQWASMQAPYYAAMQQAIPGFGQPGASGAVTPPAPPPPAPAAPQTPMQAPVSQQPAQAPPAAPQAAQQAPAPAAAMPPPPPSQPSYALPTTAEEIGYGGLAEAAQAAPPTTPAQPAMAPAMQAASTPERAAIESPAMAAAENAPPQGRDVANPSAPGGNYPFYQNGQITGFPQNDADWTAFMNEVSSGSQQPGKTADRLWDLRDFAGDVWAQSGSDGDDEKYRRALRHFNETVEWLNKNAGMSIDPNTLLSSARPGGTGGTGGTGGGGTGGGTTPPGGGVSTIPINQVPIPDWFRDIFSHGVKPEEAELAKMALQWQAYQESRDDRNLGIGVGQDYLDLLQNDPTSQGIYDSLEAMRNNPTLSPEMIERMKVTGREQTAGAASDIQRQMREAAAGQGIGNAEIGSQSALARSALASQQMAAERGIDIEAARMNREDLQNYHQALLGGRASLISPLQSAYMNLASLYAGAPGLVNAGNPMAGLTDYAWADWARRQGSGGNAMGGAMSGAMGGVAAGAPLGPFGMIAGGVLGGASGYMGSS